MVIRVSTIGQHEQMITDIGLAQSQLADLQRQISSGKKADSFPTMGSSISRVVDLESRIKSVQHFESGNNIVISRLDAMGNSVDALTTLAQQFRGLLTQERGASGNVLDITTAARDSLKKVADALNNNLNGRFLFAGGKTDVPPVNSARVLESNLSLDDEGNPIGTDAYYDGDSEAFIVQASDNLELEYGITGDNEAFRMLIGAMHKAINSETESGTIRDDKLGEAMDMINTAIDRLTQVNYSINSNAQTLKDINSVHTTATIQLKEFLGKESDSDIVDASIKVSLLQATLTAQMQTFARISGLSLTKFLN